MNDQKFTHRDMFYQVVEELTANDPDAIMSNARIIDKINEKYGKQSRSSMQCLILSETVNAPSRIHYGHRKPRIIDTATKRDLLFNIGNGQIVKYDPNRHGMWEIYRDDETQKLVLAKIETEPPVNESLSTAFALESHLRDYLAKNLGSLAIRNKKLELIKTEYPTGVGPIDILAKDDEGNFYVFELKCSRGTDKALGQILRYMGWLVKEEAKDKKVYGIIVAEKIDEKLKYATQAVKDIDLFEYEVNFQLKNLP